MAIRDAMRESATGFLQPGEQIQAVIGAQTASPYAAALAGPLALLGSLLLMAFNRYRILVATSQRILVLDAGKMSMKKARGVIAELPRSTRLGPASGVWHVIPVDGKKLRVHRRFFKDIKMADEAAILT
jgi:hypothetical protein